MTTGIHTKEAYRYPGSRPFYDNEIDRCLFFGRDDEKESLLHKVLADNLVVLYAKSGLGKTSLINAGLNQELRERGFIPLPVRFNDPDIEPVQAVYEGIEETVKQKSLDYVDYEEGEEDSLWQYFKTAHFWSPDDTLLKPVLILDQFEEFFVVHASESRKRFTRQLADLVNEDIPKELRESVSAGEPFPYSEKSPNVKIIISIREDFLGQLEEMSSEITDILTNRFRLLPLSREQARQAIVEPSQVQDEIIRAASFKFTPEAVDMMLDFLCKRRERGKIKISDEVESFQLQLLCQHVEDKVRDRASITITGDFKDATFHNESYSILMKNQEIKTKREEEIIEKNDLGGEKEMQWVLQQFYDKQIEKLDTLWRKRRARRLFGKGLISIDNRRLSLEEGEIERKFRISKKNLEELVNYRLLRSEPRAGSIYYELIHDTLVHPILESQAKRKRIAKKVAQSIFIVIFIIGIIGLLIDKTASKDPKSEINKFHRKAAENAHIFLKDQEIIINSCIDRGQQFYEKEEFNKAISFYEAAIDICVKLVANYNQLENTFFAKCKFREIKNYRIIYINPKYSKAYYNIGVALSGLKKYNEAIEAYKKAIYINPKYAEAYYSIGVALSELKKYNEAIAAYKKAIEIAPEYNYSAKTNLTEAYLLAEQFDRAFKLANELLKEKGIFTDQILTIRFVSISAQLFLGRQQEAVDHLKAFISYYKSLSEEYERRRNYTTIKEFISQNKKMPPEQTQLLLQLVDILEAPKWQGDKKIKKLEVSIPKIFK